MGAWSGMIPEILTLISDRLPLLDFVSFRQVCRGWRLAPSDRSEITNFPKETPWLMFYDFDNTTNKCYLYSQHHPNPVSFNLPLLQGSNIIYTKYDWLLAHCSHNLFLCNPFSLENIHLPKLDVSAIQTRTCTCTFTTISAKTVFIVNRRTDSILELRLCRAGSTEWETQTIQTGMNWVDGAKFTVFSCSCRDVSECSCGLESVICVHDTNEGLIYDYVEERCVTEFYLGLGSTKSKASSCYEQMLAVHKDDWLRKFGVKGVRISVSANNMSPTGESFQSIRGCSVDSFTVVKAAWVEPGINKEAQDDEGAIFHF